MVEGVDLDVALLADVAAARLQQRPRPVGADACDERQALRLVVDTAGRRGRRRGGDGRVVGEGRGAPLGAAAQLDGLEQRRCRAAQRDCVRMLDRQLVERCEHAQRGPQIGRVDAAAGTGRHGPESSVVRPSSRRPRARPGRHRRGCS